MHWRLVTGSIMPWAGRRQGFPWLLERHFGVMPLQHYSFCVDKKKKRLTTYLQFFTYLMGHCCCFLSFCCCNLSISCNMQYLYYITFKGFVKVGRVFLIKCTCSIFVGSNLSREIFQFFYSFLKLCSLTLNPYLWTVIKTLQ